MPRVVRTNDRVYHEARAKLSEFEFNRLVSIHESEAMHDTLSKVTRYLRKAGFEQAAKDIRAGKHWVKRD